MKVTRKPGRVRAASLRAIALFGLMSGPSYARDANDLLLKAVGTTEGVSFRSPRTPAQKNFA